jgi:predicted AAA+ superfamily ATPase
MIKREITPSVLALAKQFPVISIIGPRQSGKTTLVKNIFPEKDYVNLEEPDTRLFAQTDPRAFLNGHPNGLIIDEAQRLPDLFSYIQVIVDSDKTSAQFILTGSQHFLLHERISQTLAGRAAIFTLLPFSFGELENHYENQPEYQDYIFKGFYPAIYDRNIAPKTWLANYVKTYVERDVRMLKNITDLNSFTLFLKICAGRCGQLINNSAIASEIGISTNTVRAWLSVLEASFIVFLLRPHFKNFNKRLVKMPKLYFYDTGLASYLLGITNTNQINFHHQKGALFENLIISEFMKYAFNFGLEPNLYFWRDKLGREIDCLIDRGEELTAVEIKSGQTITNEYFKNIKYWKDLSGSADDNYVIYGGSQIQKRSDTQVLPWRQMRDVF